MLQYKSDTEKKLQEQNNLLSKLKAEQNELLSNLEDEKRKNEDLQFRFEEAAITKGDIEVKKPLSLVYIHKLFINFCVIYSKILWCKT